MSEPDDTVLLETPLHAEHVAGGAKMVGFAGYAMPVQYRAGIMAEHNHVRAAAGLFDVSHMGQVRLGGADADEALEQLVPGDIAGLAPWAMRYTQLTNEAGGIIDDLMVTRTDDGLWLVVNAARKHEDLAHLSARLGSSADITHVTDRALIALQGPRAAAVLARHAPACATLSFMTACRTTVAGVEAMVSRSGYTGEDGFEISIPADAAAAVWRTLLDEPQVEPVGLGARDSLRLEAGLCLYGHDIDESTSPVEAALAWSIGKRRRVEGGFLGAARIQRELAEGPARRRVGIEPDGRAPAREGTTVHDASGAEIGVITSGGFGPTFGGPIAMGFVEQASSKAETPVSLMVRGKPRPATVVPLPFVPHRYHRG